MFQHKWSRGIIYDNVSGPGTTYVVINGLPDHLQLDHLCGDWPFLKDRTKECPETPAFTLALELVWFQSHIYIRSSNTDTISICFSLELAPSTPWLPLCSSAGPPGSNALGSVNRIALALTKLASLNINEQLVIQSTRPTLVKFSRVRVMTFGYYDYIRACLRVELAI